MRPSAAVLLLLGLSVLLVPPLRAGPSLTASVRMRDGVELPTDVYLPEGHGPRPAVLERTPYGREGLASSESSYTSFGMAYVGQDMRSGVNGSDQFVPFLDDGWGMRQDGFDTVEWIASQEWCNGRVMMVGSSASAIAALMAAGTAPPALTSIRSIDAGSDVYSDVAYPGGVFRRELVQGFLTVIHNTASLDILVAHPGLDSFWDPVRLSLRRSDVNVPILQEGGWFDLYTDATLETATLLDSRGGPGARSHQIVIIGPWTHTAVGEQTQGDLTFPPNAEIGADLANLINAFTAETLQGDHFGIFDLPRYQYYLMGDVDDPGAPGNEWRSSFIWPPPAIDRVLYLHGDGTLRDSMPASAEALTTSYACDPSDPIPTRGGHNIYIGAGPQDQRILEARPDVVTFTTGSLPSPSAVTGPVRCRLFVSSTAPDADFFVKLCDVYPDGRSMLITEGALQARRRNGPDQEDLMVPGEVYALDIEVGQTALVFNTGHRLRISVASSNFPRFEVNPQTGAPLELDDPVTAVATHTIHHSPTYPSQLIVPIAVSPEASGLLLR